MTHELLHEKLRSGQMDDEHRDIIEKFLHAHRHSHGPDQHEHVHLHIHPHGHEHLHDHTHDEHVHGLEYGGHDNYLVTEGAQGTGGDLEKTGGQRYTQLKPLKPVKNGKNKI
jgi:hypothetical protein